MSVLSRSAPSCAKQAVKGEDASVFCDAEENREGKLDFGTQVTEGLTVKYSLKEGSVTRGTIFVTCIKKGLTCVREKRLPLVRKRAATQVAVGNTRVSFSDTSIAVGAPEPREGAGHRGQGHVALS